MPSSMNLIGLTGRKGSGKDTVAQIIAEMTPIRHHSFARKMKESVCQLFGIDMAFLEEAKNDYDIQVEVCKRDDSGVAHVFSSMSFRFMLQRYGTESHRDVFGSDFWMDQALPLTGEVLHPTFLNIFTDVRFENEAQRVRGLGGKIFEVVGPPSDEDWHSSETPLPRDLVDGYIDNTVWSGTLTRLEDQVRNSLLAEMIS